jgi:hypothetical protein
VKWVRNAAIEARNRLIILANHIHPPPPVLDEHVPRALEQWPPTWPPPRPPRANAPCLRTEVAAGDQAVGAGGEDEVAARGARGYAHDAEVEEDEGVARSRRGPEEEADRVPRARLRGCGEGRSAWQAPCPRRWRLFAAASLGGAGSGVLRRDRRLAVADEEAPIAAATSRGLREGAHERAHQRIRVHHLALGDHGLWAQSRARERLHEEVGACRQRHVVHEEPVQPVAIRSVHGDIAVGARGAAACV